MSGKAALFSNVPGRARRACDFLLVLGVLWGAFGLVALYVTVQDGADGFREYFTAYLLIISAGALASCILLAAGKRASLWVAWIVLPFVLIFFPVGTLFGVLAIAGMVSPDMKTHLARDG